MSPSCCFVLHISLVVLLYTLQHGYTHLCVYPQSTFLFLCFFFCILLPVVSLCWAELIGTKNWALKKKLFNAQISWRIVRTYGKSVYLCDRCVSKLLHVDHVSMHLSKIKTAAMNFTGCIDYCEVFPIQPLSLTLCTGGSTTVMIRQCAVVEREKHLRLVSNVLWKMHNFRAFTSELCSSTLLRLWANWAIRAVLYSEIVFTGQTDKTSHISVDKGEKNIVQQDWATQ